MPTAASGTGRPGARTVSGRTALVTGGASGIGFAVAERLLREGAKVATLDLTEDGPEDALPLTADVRRSEEIGAAVERAESELGPIDVLVCSAGVSGDSLHTVDVVDDEWQRVMAINADGTFFANRAVIAGITERNYGRIVNVASIAGRRATRWPRPNNAGSPGVAIGIGTVTLPRRRVSVIARARGVRSDNSIGEGFLDECALTGSCGCCHGEHRAVDGGVCRGA
jgi:NAD(P)-dependent dehydrogenase (short-subunit alcohol dehydrogenase family)